MTPKNPIAQLTDSRLGRYLVAASAFVAGGVPSQAAPITVLLPTPVNVNQGYYPVNVDGNFLTDFYFSGAGGSSAFIASGFWAEFVAQPGNLGPGVLNLLSSGTSVVLAHTDPIWANPGTAAVPSTTSPDYFIGFRFASNSTFGALAAATRIGFAQLNGPLLYGWAWDDAPSITVFNLRSSSTGDAPIPEPATGALTALALGAAALAARKRKKS